MPALTPALSVLSAVEGIAIVLPAFEPLVVPMAAVILIALFARQRRGTPLIGRLFGPVMLVRVRRGLGGLTLPVAAVFGYDAA